MEERNYRRVSIGIHLQAHTLISQNLFSKEMQSYSFFCMWEENQRIFYTPVCLHKHSIVSPSFGEALKENMIVSLSWQNPKPAYEPKFQGKKIWEGGSLPARLLNAWMHHGQADVPGAWPMGGLHSALGTAAHLCGMSARLLTSLRKICRPSPAPMTALCRNQVCQLKAWRTWAARAAAQAHHDSWPGAARLRLSGACCSSTPNGRQCFTQPGCRVLSVPIQRSCYWDKPKPHRLWSLLSLVPQRISVLLLGGQPLQHSNTKVQKQEYRKK